MSTAEYRNVLSHSIDAQFFIIFFMSCHNLQAAGLHNYSWYIFIITNKHDFELKLLTRYLLAKFAKNTEKKVNKTKNEETNV